MDQEKNSFIEVAEIFQQRLTAGKIRFLLPQNGGLWENHPGFLYHLETEFFLQINGGCEFRFPRQKIELIPGDLLLVPPGMPHKERGTVRSGEKFRNFVITSRENRISIHEAACPVSGTAIPFVAHRAALSDPGFYFHLLQTLPEWRDHHLPECGQIRTALLHVLLQKLLFDLRNLPQAAAPANPLSELRKKTQLAKKYLDDNIPSRFPDVAETARAAGCSPNYLSTVFRRETGMTIKEYINTLKFDYARQMLESGTFNISEVAGSCGFNDLSYFSRKFRERFGCTPSKLR